nr:MAG TPA: hypothetical protein [Caudoviricetes sp.]DAZ02068.1 MAG TPA: hypothetical protein [Caudoviricetes sp.]
MLFCVFRFKIKTTEPAKPLDATAPMRIMAGYLHFRG